MGGYTCGRAGFDVAWMQLCGIVGADGRQL